MLPWLRGQGPRRLQEHSSLNASSAASAGSKPTLLAGGVLWAGREVPRPALRVSCSVACVRRYDDVDPLEFLQVRITGGRHGAPQRANEVGRAVGVVAGSEEDLLQRAHGADVGAVT